MTRWQPQLDLMRLVEALAGEIVGATDYEVQRACDEGWCTAAAAQEVRELIHAVSDPGASGIDADVDPLDERADLERSTHHGNAAKPGRTCHRPH
jgi:hypothetical protein